MSCWHYNACIIFCWKRHHRLFLGAARKVVPISENRRRKSKLNTTSGVGYMEVNVKTKATRSLEISRQQVQKLTQQFVFIYILDIDSPLSPSTIVFLNKKIFCFFIPRNLFFSRNVGNSIKCKKNSTPPPPPPPKPPPHLTCLRSKIRTRE